MKSTFRQLLIGSLVAGATSFFASAGVAADTAADTRHLGRATVYKNLEDNSLESTTAPDLIARIGANPANFAPTAIWEALEHGEKVECLNCIPGISKLLFDGSAKTREISAWWLRRRIFGVFGPGEVYAQTIGTLTDPSQPDLRRAYAAEALGEFLSSSGIKYVASALVNDKSALVRTSSATALARLNSQGPNGELGTALADRDESVKMAALSATTRINVFTHVDEIAALISDPSARVRLRAAENLGMMRVKDSVVGLVALTSPANEPDARVRAAALGALGKIADPASRPAVQAAQNDSDGFVRDAARIALRRL